MTIQPRLTALLLLSVVASATVAHVTMPPPTEEEQKAMDAITSRTPTAELITLIDSNSYHVGRKAARVLGERRDKDALAPLMESLREATGVDERWRKFYALLALCLMQTRDALPAIEAEGAAAVDLVTYEVNLSPDDERALADVRRGYCTTVAGSATGEQRAKLLVARLASRPDWVKAGLVAIGEPAVPLLTAVARDEDKALALRRSAIECLAQIRSNAVRPFLVGLLKEGLESGASPPARSAAGYAATALGQLGEEGAASALIDGAKATEDWRLRVHMIDALGELGSATALPFLRELTKPEGELTRTTKPEKRIPVVVGHAAMALAQVRITLAEDKTTELIAILSDEHPWARATAAKALTEGRDKRAAPALIQALSDENQNVASFAAVALGRLGDRRAVEPLMQLLQDPKSPQHVSALNALAELGLWVKWSGDQYLVVDPQELVEQLASKDESTQQEAIDLLTKVGPVAAEMAASALRSPDARLRASAEAVVARLVDELSGSDSARVSAVVGTLYLIGAPVAGPVAKLLDSKEAHTRRAAASVLGRIGESAIPSLTSRLLAAKSTAEEGAQAAAQTLATMGGGAGVPALGQLLKGPNPNARALAAWALGLARGDDAISLLVGALQDESPEVRRQAEKACLAVESGELVSRIEKALPTVSAAPARLAMASVLAHRGSKATLPVLLSLLREGSDPDVRAGSLRALRLLRDSRAVVPILDASADANPKVAFEADAALRSLNAEELAEALRTMGCRVPPRVEDGALVLRKALQGQDQKVAALAALMSGKLRSADALPEVVASLDASPYKLCHAIALSYFRDRRATGALVKTLASKHAVLRYAAARGLSMSRDRTALPALKALAADQDARVRATARIAIMRLETTK